MYPRVPVPLDKIRAFCSAYQVRELALFGSVLRDDFGPGSDVDVLVTFCDGARPGLLDLVRMEEDLQAVFGRPVDLVDRRAVERSENYIRRRSILDGAEVVHAA